MKTIYKKVDSKPTNRILKNSTLVEFDENGIKYYDIFINEHIKKNFKFFKIKINIKTTLLFQIDLT
jgi:hypothetical protein